MYADCKRTLLVHTVNCEAALADLNYAVELSKRVQFEEFWSAGGVNWQAKGKKTYKTTYNYKHHRDLPHSLVNEDIASSLGKGPGRSKGGKHPSRAKQLTALERFINNYRISEMVEWVPNDIASDCLFDRALLWFEYIKDYDACLEDLTTAIRVCDPFARIMFSHSCFT